MTKLKAMIKKQFAPVFKAQIITRVGHLALWKNQMNSNVY